MADNRPVADGSSTNERYTVLERLAVGGMGEVFLARQRGIGGFQRAVVLKKLLPQSETDGDVENAEDAHRRFLDEARVVAALAHENVVSVIEVGETDGAPYLALEYVHGENAAALRSRAKKQQLRFPVVVAARIVADAARGLAHAHHAVDVDGRPLHIVHRDVAPKNIFVRSDGTSKIGDFGIARSSHRLSKTATGAVPGTLSYMSPEQARGDEVGPASDQFSLGIVLWELLTGERLFRRDSPTETLKAILQSRIPKPSTRRPDASVLDAVVMRMLDRDEHARFPSLTDVAEAIEAELPETRLALGEKAVALFVESVAGDDLRSRRRRIEEGPEATALVSRNKVADVEGRAPDATPATPAVQPGEPTVNSRSGSAEISDAPTTRDRPARADVARPHRKSRAVALASSKKSASLGAAAIALTLALGGGAMMLRAPSAAQRTRQFLDDARARHPFLHKDVFLAMAQVEGADAATAARIADPLVALLDERLALLQTHWAKPADVRAQERAALVEQELALVDRARALLAPLPEKLRTEALDMWNYDASAPVQWLPPLTVAEIQTDLKNSSVEYMKSQAELRRIAVERMTARACQDPANVRARLKPLVDEREALLVRWADAPFAELESLDDRTDDLERRGAALLEEACGGIHGPAIASVAFHWVTDPDEPEPLHEATPSSREERLESARPSVH